MLAGGAALAQSDLIVDPWQRVLTGKARLGPPVPESRRADSGWLDEGPSPAPKPVVAPWSPPPSDLVADPWVSRAPARSPGAPPLPSLAPVVRSPDALHPTHWARVVPEIVDPWGPEKLAAYRDPLIVDPWSN